ncbi:MULTISPECIES: McrB family protein [Leuconostoc]|uniref:McrB family protein n=1 Tax=Leuconostoc TaxID=1243 RepID=UPI0021822219|nr:MULTISPECIES: AAA family ATPase [Leuconostoc]MCS8586833.1 AAA family ATPase [Leuconostoc citreum]MCS8598734.1 AAA family ATPase [Leuconostoc citreum]MDI6550962.1 AAA family ATPase [Leuconostoc suionicum]
MSSFTEWAVKYGKLQRGTATTYWSGLKNTKFKSDDIPLTDIDNIEDYIFRTGKHNVEKSDIKKLFNTPDYRNDSDILSFIQKYVEYLKNSQDYENFFAMLKFWVKQTENNIEDDGKRVGFQEIKSENVIKAENMFTDPKFRKEYITYSDFSIRISFFRSGQYKGDRVNFIVYWPKTLKSRWLNIRYQHNSQQIVVNYRRELSNNTDSLDFKEYMTKLGYETGTIFQLSELSLSEQMPNDKVKALFDYFHEMVLAANSFKKEGDNLKALEFIDKLKQDYNIILHGAPGTGKTFLAKSVAAGVISNGETTNFSSLTEEQQNQIGFVQFHPSYDYTDFVEGLRPLAKSDGNVGFELKNGIFVEFVKKALRQTEHAPQLGEKQTIENQEQIYPVTKKPFVFIIDEINRGEISKIFGELFYSIDPGYRGKTGAVSTQYANLHDDPSEKFFVPENVYIIGTMNDIDRSVDSFDFAMRRRFRFVEIKASDQLKMLDTLEESVREQAVKKLTDLNNAISATEELNENYQIGPSYFLKLEQIDFDELWNDYLQPLLEEYIRGMYNESEIMDRFQAAYYQKSTQDENDTNY